MAQEYVRNLIKKTMAGDKEARQDLLKGYANDIVYRSRLYLGDETSAKAATTDIFMKMLNTLDQALEADAFDDWYQKIVRDVAIRKVIPLTSDGVIKNIPYTRSDEVADVNEKYSVEDSRRMILNIITKLPKAERVVSTLYFFDGLTVKDIAQKLYLTEGEVESLITKAKTKINASGVSLGAFLQMLANIKQTSVKTETLPISVIRNTSEETPVEEEYEEEVVEESDSEYEETYDEVVDDESLETEEEVYDEDLEYEDEVDEETDHEYEEIYDESEEYVVDEDEELLIEDDNELLIDDNLDLSDESEPIFFTKHNRIIEDTAMHTEEIPQLDGDEEIVVEKPVERVVRKEVAQPIEEKVAVKEEAQKPLVATERRTATRKPASKRRRVNWLHLFIVIGIALLLLMGLWYLLSKGKSNEPEVINITPEPTAAVEVENNEPAENEETAQEPTSEKEETGTLVVNPGVVINVRQGPSTESAAVGSVYEGEEYHVYEIEKAGEYTWYRIGDDQWIADGGGWVEFTAD